MPSWCLERKWPRNLKPDTQRREKSTLYPIGRWMNRPVAGWKKDAAAGGQMVLFFSIRGILGGRMALAVLLEAADVHLVTQRPEADRLVVPSKLYGILESGRPFCFVGSARNEISALLSKHKMGFRVEPGDAAGLAA